MKIVINENQNYDETEVVINCRETDESILKILSALKSVDKKLTGTENGKTHIIDPVNVLYFDTVDKKTFIYTGSGVFETDLKLYEIETRLKAMHFFRASKSFIINIAKIKTISPGLGGRLEITLHNNERLIVSRQYAHELKLKLGI